MEEFNRWIEFCGNQSEAAKQYGCSRAYISLMATGTIGIGLRTARKIEKCSKGRFKARDLLEL